LGLALAASLTGCGSGGGHDPSAFPVGCDPERLTVAVAAVLQSNGLPGVDLAVGEQVEVFGLRSPDSRYEPLNHDAGAILDGPFRPLIAGSLGCYRALTPGDTKIGPVLRPTGCGNCAIVVFSADIRVHPSADATPPQTP
jgi:hypothetical protein